MQQQQGLALRQHRRQRPLIACVCFTQTRSNAIVVASLIVALTLSLFSMILQQPPRLIDRDNAIIFYSGVPHGIVVSSSMQLPATISRNDSRSIHNVTSVVEQDMADSVSHVDRLDSRDTVPVPVPVTDDDDDDSSAQHRFSSDPSTSPPFVIFYNIYLHKDRFHHGIGIVQEQLGQIAKSYAALSHKQSQKQKLLTIYYNTVGAPAFTNSTYMDDMCASHGFDCRHMQHYESGFEEVTLQRVHDFCIQTQADKNHGNDNDHDHDNSHDMSVIYMHNKGSFTDTSLNKFWRRHLTMAVTSEHCLKPANNTCNVCSLQFWPQWVPFFPGNFFTAKCSYVKRLVPARNFSSSTAIIKDQVTQLTKQDKLAIRLFPPDKFPPEPDRYGLDRFASEHWIGSSPHLVPCDLSDSANIRYWYMQDRNESELNFVMAPRRPLRAPLKLWPVMSDMKKTKLAVLNSPTLRSKEYFLLPGYIYKWHALYREFPPPSSWVWSWFPDGEVWRDRVATHGINTIDWMFATTTNLTVSVL